MKKNYEMFLRIRADPLLPPYPNPLITPKPLLFFYFRLGRRVWGGGGGGGGRPSPPLCLGCVMSPDCFWSPCSGCGMLSLYGFLFYDHIYNSSLYS